VVDHAHCDILETAAETGIVGLALCLWALISFLSAVFTSCRSAQNAHSVRLAYIAACAGAIMAVVVQSFVCINTRCIQVSLPATIIAGLGVAAIGVGADGRRLLQYSLARKASSVLRVCCCCVLLVCTLAATYCSYRCIGSKIHQDEAVMLQQTRWYGGTREDVAEMVLWHLEKSTLLNPYNVESWYELAGIYDRYHMHHHALFALRKVCGLWPNYGEAYLMTARAYEHLGQHALSMAWLQRYHAASVSDDPDP
jgi:uncharacterized membrane protein